MLLVGEEMLKMQMESPESKAGQGRQAGPRTKLMLDAARQERGMNFIWSAPRQGRQMSNGGLEERQQRKRNRQTPSQD